MLPVAALEDLDTDELLRRADAGRRAAVDVLLARHRGRLRQMVRVRMDPRLAARADPSDIVQEALLEASQRIGDYLRQRPLPFFPWLRQLAWDRLVELQRRHVQAQKRSVAREQPLELGLSDESAAGLAGLLITSGTSPSKRLAREELRDGVRQALSRLPTTDRELLVMRYLEQLSNSEMAALLGISERTVKWRHRRALERLQGLLGDSPSGGPR
jgi:RNA polymerase sigma-70 factor (ECF subfamily)